MYNTTVKKDIIKVVIAVMIFLIISILNIDLIDGFLSKFLSEKSLFYFSRLIYAGAVVDFLYILLNITTILCNKVVLKTHDNIKNNIESKIVECKKSPLSSDFSLNSAEIINKIINTYNTENSKEYSKEFCKELEDYFYKEKADSKRIISYFILANNTYDSISNYIENNNIFYKDCLSNHKEVISELNNFDFKTKNTHLNENEFNDILVYLLHSTLEKDPVDITVVNYLKSLHSWFCGNIYNNYKHLTEERFILLLQFLPEVVDKINYYHKAKTGKITITYKSINFIKIKLLIRFFANKATFKLCKTFNSKIITQSKIETYARYAGLVTRYYSSVFVINKIILYVTLILRNQIFNNLYYKVTGYYAVSLLLVAEAIVANVNSDDRLGDKVANLIISVAGFAI